MAIDQRIESLKKRHANIESQLQTEEARPAPDVARIHQLKKDKLLLKDELSRLQDGEKEAA